MEWLCCLVGNCCEDISVLFTHLGNGSVDSRLAKDGSGTPVSLCYQLNNSINCISKSFGVWPINTA